MIASFTKGNGTVVNAASTDWVRGLVHRDEIVEQITRNVFDRLGAS